MKNKQKSKLVVTMITVIITTLFCHSGENASGATPAEIQEWLQVHNQYRSLHGVPPVTWSATVAASAQAWADTCPSGHSSSGYGENMAWATYIMSPKDVVDYWYSEEPFYDYNNPGWDPKYGHFTQVVWKSTIEIGCGYRTGCSSGYSNVWVCQYNPPGNYIGQFAANVLPPISGLGEAVDNTSLSWTTGRMPTGLDKLQLSILFIKSIVVVLRPLDGILANFSVLSGEAGGI